VVRLRGVAWLGLCCGVCQGASTPVASASALSVLMSQPNIQRALDPSYLEQHPLMAVEVQPNDASQGVGKENMVLFFI
jgi:hypothetical protein